MRVISSVVCAGALLVSVNVVAGDVAAGKAIFAGKGCAACHGAVGKSSVPATPSLTGRDADFVKTALSNFKSGQRQNVTMNAMAGMLSDADVDNVASYIATLTP